MQLIDVFILTKKTRPTLKESYIILYQVYKALFNTKTDEEILTDLQHKIPIHMSNLMDSNTPFDINRFIKYENCEEYLTNTDLYKVETMEGTVGNPPDDVIITLVFKKTDQDKKVFDILNFQNIKQFLDRGAHYNALGRYGDEIQCYQSALLVYKAHPELLYRLGAAQMRYTELLSYGFQNLQQALHSDLNNIGYMMGVAMANLQLINSQTLLSGTNRHELLHITVNLVNRASKLDPGHERVIWLKEELAALEGWAQDTVNEMNKDFNFFD